MPKLNAAFWKWFEESKIVDESGDPLVAYHGSTSVRFDEFKHVTPVRQRTGPDGFYFTSDLAAASNYRTHPKTRSRGDVFAVYLSIQNPLDITSDIRKLQKKKMTFGEAKREALEKLTPDHDGVIFRGNAYNADEIIAFDPSQIKSINNDGTWDVDDPDIRSNPELSFKESLGQEWPVGTTRKLQNGHVQTLTMVKSKSIPYTQGNKIFAEAVEKWKSRIVSGDFIPYPDVRIYEGKPYIDDGHHRIEAARQLKIKEIPVWLEILE